MATQESKTTDASGGSLVAPAPSTAGSLAAAQVSPASPPPKPPESDGKEAELLAEIKTLRAALHKKDAAIEAAEKAKEEAIKADLEKRAKEQGEWQALAQAEKARAEKLAGELSTYQSRIKEGEVSSRVRSALIEAGIKVGPQLDALAKLVRQDVQIEWEGDLPKADFAAAAKKLIETLGIHAGPGTVSVTIQPKQTAKARLTPMQQIRADAQAAYESIAGKSGR